jgi:hypothetical protein
VSSAGTACAPSPAIPRAVSGMRRWLV